MDGRMPGRSTNRWVVVTGCKGERGVHRLGPVAVTRRGGRGKQKRGKPSLEGCCCIFPGREFCNWVAGRNNRGADGGFATVTGYGELIPSAKRSHTQGILPPATPLLKEKITRLRFYFHDMIGGPVPTVVRVAGVTPEPGFGSVFVTDDPLTEGPELTSKLIGKVQGLYAFAGEKEMSMVMALSYVFLEGTYKGSSLSILGRSDAFNGVKEMPVVGGSGLFRLARGYALAKTFFLNLTTGNAVIEYDVFVIHY